MAWKELSVVDQRKNFIDEFLKYELTMAELCRQYEISRTIGYKWLARFKAEGYEGLIDRSRAPIVQARETCPEIISEILRIKAKWGKWGPKKILARLQMEQPDIIWPSITTIGNILSRHGLVVPRKYRKPFPAKNSSLTSIDQLNDVWSVDFKGWFITKDGCKCDPLTLTDNFSRYLLRCVKLPKNDVGCVWALFDAAFREYGLPYYVRHDNGPPFATSSVGRLSSLSIRLIKAGVIPEWIEPGNPQQNGRHERMHGTLQQEGVFPELTLEEQMMKFKEFQEYYNFERPHESIGNQTPGSIYRPSDRMWTGRLKSPEYPDDYKKGRVRSCGKMLWKGQEIYIGRVLADEYVGIKEDPEIGYEMYFGPILLGKLTKENEFQIERRKVRKRTYKKSLKETEKEK